MTPTTPTRWQAFLILLLNSVFWGLGWAYGLPRRICATVGSYLPTEAPAAILFSRAPAVAAGNTGTTTPWAPIQTTVRADPILAAQLGAAGVAVNQTPADLGIGQPLN